MATNISSIGSGGRDYATIGAWVTATAVDLVAAGDIEVGELYNDSVFDEHVVIDGATTDADNYRILRVADGEGHNGTYAGAGVTVRPSDSGHVFEVLEDFMQMGAGMLIELRNGTSSDEAVRIGDASNDALRTLVEDAIIWDSGGASDADGVYGGNWTVGGNTNPVVVRNCIIHGFERAGIHMQNFASSRTHWWDIVNCTIVNCGRAIGYDLRFAGSTIITHVINNVLLDSADGDDFGSTNATDLGTLTTTDSLNNLDETGTVPAGTTITASDNPDGFVPSNPAYFRDLTSYADLRLLPHRTNLAIRAGVGGPPTNALVPGDDMIGQRHTGPVIDPGPLQASVNGNDLLLPAPNTLASM